MLSRSSYVRFFVTPWTVARQAPLSMGFSRQEYWSGLPCPPPGDLPDPGIKPTSLKSPSLAGEFFINSTIMQIILVCRRVKHFFLIEGKDFPPVGKPVLQIHLSVTDSAVYLL